MSGPPEPPPGVTPPDVSGLRPPMYALIRTYLTDDYWTGAQVLGGHQDMNSLGVLAGGAARMVLEACGGDWAKALSLVDRWLTAAVAEAAVRNPLPAARTSALDEINGVSQAQPPGLASPAEPVSLRDELREMGLIGDQ